MGYTTDFYGGFDILPPLSPEHAAYLRQFAEIRHMRRDGRKLANEPDPLRVAVGLGLGHEGEFYVGTADKISSQGSFGTPKTTADNTILDNNQQPPTQPGLWCQWLPNEAGDQLVWDGGEKFYHYDEWLEYLIVNFFNPWGYSLCGIVEWQGEDPGDMGRLIIAEATNQVTITTPTITWN